MSRLVQRGEIALLSAALALSACTATTQIPLSGTSMPQTTTSAIEMRALSQTEKAALARTLSKAVTNPSAAQFKWLPVAANGSGPIGYCGLVNVKSRNGEYVGFRRFFAMISKGPKGDYVTGRIEHIEAIPTSFSGDDNTDGAAQTGLTERNCNEWGYTDFNGAT